ncbi:MAG: ECF-type sigma factor [Planctomycetota bacterium]|mgnify:CR=1 FL=1|jgi:RNA polymerase sigma factor (TIGR02999 family)|nr:ECF-type sigma factor [Planctomycetota bacterium]MEC7499157.1 ECF-type sigma factor [Planctomycetota bacterium]MEC7603820.1 ECF-type sigma factor [Planctomycetota bacterium]MEC7978573.1 ECF-type sigma factor [Planctomycetota bacterium]MEC8159551.1 ECF-type sigma factor [Planctomycetota bacterium]
MSSITAIIGQLQRGDPVDSDARLSEVYGELKKLAISRLDRERRGLSIQPTVLVHETYLRLLGTGAEVRWKDRTQFFSHAAETMRRIVVERARSKKTIKAGGEYDHFPISEMKDLVAPESALIELDDTLNHFAKIDREAAEMIKLRVFVGLSLEEAADVLGISRTTAFRTWTFARAWIKKTLSQPHK